MKKNHKKIINYEIVSLNKTANSSTMANVYILSHTCPPPKFFVTKNLPRKLITYFIIYLNSHQMIFAYSFLPFKFKKKERKKEKLRKIIVFFLEIFV